jgi:acetyl-CoA carboxylase biotin carboxyl carrier protein
MFLTAMTLDEIRELIQVVTETGIAELEVQRGDNRVRIRRTTRGHLQEYVIPAESVAHHSQHAAAPATPTAQGAGAAPALDPLSDPTLVTVKSPIVGTFYEAPSPGAPPFVRVGDIVKPGDVLCIIESMKLMNEIEAETGGAIVSKLAANAQPVEYGEALFLIRPA